ncbi:MAG: hypothetical protein A2X49_11630 [Lentisphaerae bacterium GWF2_52_8]|nr:MAG: hypothetical protein A2X49_11630 [Lentisphaerae bacterium GWF2_52_8]
MKHKFTLIELLVVIAIIGILASLLFPSLKSAKDAARRIQCLGTMKQIGMLMVSYVGNNRDVLPPGFVAPTWGEPFNDNFAWRTLLARENGYYSVQQKTQASKLFTCSVNAAIKNIGQNNNFGGKKITSTKQPGIRLLYCDSDTWCQFRDENTGGGGIFFNEYVPGIANYAPAVPKILFTKASNPNEWYDIFEGRHSRSANGGFLDGHAENLRPSVIGPHYMKVITQASGNNIFFP